MEICLPEACPAASDKIQYQLGKRNPIEFIDSHYTNQFDRTPFVDVDKNSQDICMNCDQQCNGACKGITPFDCEGRGKS